MFGIVFNLGIWAPFAWFLAAAVLGYALLQAMQAGRPARDIDLAELVFRSIVAGFLVILGLGLVLAELGQFRLRWLLGLLAVAGLLALLWAWRRGASWRLPKPHWEDLLPLVLALVVLLLTFRPHLSLVGADEPSIYAAIAGSIARAESITIVDPDVAALDPLWAEQELFFPASGEGASGPTYLTGFTLDNRTPGKIVPSFWHAFPAWLALNYKLGDLEGLFQALSWTTVLGVLAVYFATRALFGRRVAFVGALFLAANPIFTWFMRYPTPENLAQPLLFVLLYGLARRDDGQDRGAEVLAALSLGMLMHTQIEGILALAAVAVWLLWVLVREPSQIAHWRIFLILTGLQLLHFLVYARAFAWSYTLSAGKTLYFFSPLLTLTLLLLFGAGAIAVAVGLRRGWLAHYIGRIRLALIGLFAALALVAFFLIPLLAGPVGDQPDTSLNWLWLGWYATPWVLGIGVMGLLLLLWQQRLSKSALLLGVTLAYTISYLFHALGPAASPTGGRYLVVALVPAALLGVAYLLEQGWDFFSNWKGRLAPLLLGCALLVVSGVSAIALANHAEYDGAIGVVRQLSREVEDGAVVLFADSSAALDFGAPMRFFFGRSVFALQQDPPDSYTLRTLVEGWADQGRPTYLVSSEKVSGVYLYEFLTNRKVIFALQFSVLGGTASYYPLQFQAVAHNFAFHHLHTLPALVPGQEIVIDIGSDDDAYVHQGFHDKETDPVGNTFRWSEGEAEIELSGRWFCAQSTPTLTLVLSQNWADPEHPNPLNVRIGETALEQVAVPRDWQAVHLSIPESLGPNFCQQEVVLLHLSGPARDPWVNPTNVDTRFIGIALDKVVLTLP